MTDERKRELVNKAKDYITDMLANSDLVDEVVAEIDPEMEGEDEFDFVNELATALFGGAADGVNQYVVKYLE